MTEQELIESFAGNLDYIMRSEHMNQSELARRSHLSRESMNRIINEFEWRLNVETENK